MGQSAVEKLLDSRRSAGGMPTEATSAEGDKFSLILVGDRMEEHFLELRFRTGLRTAFAYSDLIFFNYDPESGTLDLDFGGYLITVKGRGLGERVFDGVKQKKVVWLKEADSEMQDHHGNDTFISAILITPPGFENQGEAAAA